MLTLLAILSLSGEPLTPESLAYPGARRLLEDRAAGRQLEIRWTCYATADSPDAVVRHYRADRRLEPGLWRRGEGEHGFAAKEKPELHVAVFPAADVARRGSCRAPLAPEERTIIQVSMGLPVPGRPKEDAGGSIAR